MVRDYEQIIVKAMMLLIQSKSVAYFMKKSLLE